MAKQLVIPCQIYPIHFKDEIQGICKVCKKVLQRGHFMIMIDRTKNGFTRRYSVADPSIESCCQEKGGFAALFATQEQAEAKIDEFLLKFNQEEDLEKIAEGLIATLPLLDITDESAKN